MNESPVMKDSKEKATSGFLGGLFQYAVFLVVAIFFAYCLVYRKDSPPIELAMRDGFLSSYILQASNTSSSRLVLDVYIYEGTRTAQTLPIVLDPNEHAEFGPKEFIPLWSPRVGNKGIISVRGYRRKYKFTIKEGGYLSYELIDKLPSDYPLRN